MEEQVNHPSHYDWFRQRFNGVEVDDICSALGFRLGNVFKYICRAGKKRDNGILQDLRKARWYLDKEIATYEEISRANTREANED